MPFFARGDHIGGGVAHQRHGRHRSERMPPLRFADGPFDETATRGGHLAEGSVAKKVAEAGPLQLAPADAGEVAGDQRQQKTAAGQALEQFRHAGAVLACKRRAHAQVVALRGTLDFGRGLAGERTFGAGAVHHFHDDRRVQHALPGNAFGGGFEARYLANAMNQRLPVMRPGAAHQGAIDIEQDQPAIALRMILARVAAN